MPRNAPDLRLNRVVGVTIAPVVLIYIAGLN